MLKKLKLLIYRWKFPKWFSIPKTSDFQKNTTEIFRKIPPMPKTELDKKVDKFPEIGKVKFSSIFDKSKVIWVDAFVDTGATMVVLPT